MMVVLGIPSDEEIEEYRRLLPASWTPNIDPPDYDIFDDHPHECEYCQSEQAETCIEFFMQPFLLCYYCMMLSIDDAHYAIGAI